MYSYDEPEIQRSLLGLENVEDVRSISRQLVQRHSHLLIRILHRYVNARHKLVSDYTGIRLRAAPSSSSVVTAQSKIEMCVQILYNGTVSPPETNPTDRRLKGGRKRRTTRF